ncbi:hypothetical protein Taro_042259, partial [Colocasia esculenta]|nr:hypothetical protein [Colocasia esculenta]
IRPGDLRHLSSDPIALRSGPSIAQIAQASCSHQIRLRAFVQSAAAAHRMLYMPNPPWPAPHWASSSSALHSQEPSPNQLLHTVPQPSALVTSATSAVHLAAIAHQLPCTLATLLICSSPQPRRRLQSFIARGPEQFLLDFSFSIRNLMGRKKWERRMDSQVVVCTSELDGIAGSDKIREGCFLGLLQLDLAIALLPSFGIHQQFETLSLPNFVEIFDFEFVVLAQFGIELPSCFGVDSFYHPN